MICDQSSFLFWELNTCLFHTGCLLNTGGHLKTGFTVYSQVGGVNYSAKKSQFIHVFFLMGNSLWHHCLESNNSSSCIHSGRVMVLGKLPVPGLPTRARAYCTCSRCGWGLFGHFYSPLPFLSSFSFSLEDKPI